jgi:uncharacterized protein (TIGR00369 family)
MNIPICPRAAATFSRQPFLSHLGASLFAASNGTCEIEIEWHELLTQQHGYFHAGAVTTIADTAAGLAALTLMPTGATVLTAEFKINLISPAVGARLRARGEVLKSGKRLSIVRSVVESIDGDRVQTCAHFLGTMVPITTRAERDPATAA